MKFDEAYKNFMQVTRKENLSDLYLIHLSRLFPLGNFTLFSRNFELQREAFAETFESCLKLKRSTVLVRGFRSLIYRQKRQAARTPTRCVCAGI